MPEPRTDGVDRGPDIPNAARRNTGDAIRDPGRDRYEVRPQQGREHRSAPRHSVAHPVPACGGIRTAPRDEPGVVRDRRTHVYTRRVVDASRRAPAGSESNTVVRL